MKNFLAIIRTAYYGKPNIYHPGVSKEDPAIHAAIIPEEPTEAIISREPAKLKTQSSLPVTAMKTPAIKKVNSIHNNENITRDDYTFEQNLDAVRENFFGDGAGPGKVVTENVTRDEDSFEQNLHAATEAFLGKGTGRGKIVTANVTRDENTLEQNLDAITDAYGALMTPKNVPGKIKVEQKTTQRRIKGIHY